MPRVSVIIPAYNAAAFLRDAIDSVIAQTYTDWEVVLVDDGSTDDTRPVAARYEARLGDRLHYVYQINRGLPAARNTGMRAARGELMALLDADDIWLPERLASGVAVMDQDPEIGLAHGRIAKIDGAGTIVAEPVFPARFLAGSIARHIYTRRAHLACATILFRKACLEKAGWFDEAMRATEDRDLWFRIAEHYRVGYVDRVLAYYRLSPNSMSTDLERMLTWQLYFVNKHRGSKHCTWLDTRRALASIYRERGDAAMRIGALGKALGNYWTAVRQYPPQPGNVYMLLRAVLEPVILAVRAAAATMTRQARLSK